MVQDLRYRTFEARIKHRKTEDTGSGTHWYNQINRTHRLVHCNPGFSMVYRESNYPHIEVSGSNAGAVLVVSRVVPLQRRISPLGSG